jgi:hypothetical protein
VPRLLWHGTSVFPVSEGPPQSVAFYDTRGGVGDLTRILTGKTDLIMWYRFWFERLTLKISISFFTSGDDRKSQPKCSTPLSATQIERSIIPENFMTPSFTVF